MRFEDAMDEVLIEDACAAAGLDRRATARVIQGFRRHRELIDKFLPHGGDHAAMNTPKKDGA
jgi:hypothetical protein